jgi:hypothetical protein
VSTGYSLAEDGQHPEGQEERGLVGREGGQLLRAVEGEGQEEGPDELKDKL